MIDQTAPAHARNSDVTTTLSRGVAVLIGIGLLVASITSAGSASAVGPSKNGAPGCYQNSCAGKDPVAMGCAQDAVTWDRRDYRNGNLELRYSVKCFSTWARYTPYPDGVTRTLQAAGGGWRTWVGPEIWERVGPNKPTYRSVPSSNGKRSQYYDTRWTYMVPAGVDTCVGLEERNSYPAEKNSAGISTHSEYDTSVYQAFCA